MLRVCSLPFKSSINFQRKLKEPSELSVLIKPCHGPWKDHHGKEKTYPQLSGSTAFGILSRSSVALLSVALCFPRLGGLSQENRAAPLEKVPVTPTFSALKGGVALQVASWKVSRYRGVSQLHCCLSCYSGALRSSNQQAQETDMSFLIVRSPYPDFCHC